MRNEAHVGLVDAHAKRDGGDDHDTVLVDEAILIAGAHVGVKAGMIGQRLDAGLGERSGGILDLGARQAVDDAGVAGMALADEGFQLGLRVLLVDDFILDIRAIETRNETRRAGKPTLVANPMAATL